MHFCRSGIVCAKQLKEKAAKSGKGRADEDVSTVVLLFEVEAAVTAVVVVVATAVVDVTWGGSWVNFKLSARRADWRKVTGELLLLPTLASERPVLSPFVDTAMLRRMKKVVAGFFLGCDLITFSLSIRR